MSTFLNADAHTKIVRIYIWILCEISPHFDTLWPAKEMVAVVYFFHVFRYKQRRDFCSAVMQLYMEPSNVHHSDDRLFVNFVEL